MRRFALVLSLIAALVFAAGLAVPAFGGPSLAQVARKAAKALKLAKTADTRSKKALKLAKRAAAVFAEIKNTDRVAAAQELIAEIEMASTESA